MGRVGRGTCWGEGWVAEEGNRDEYDQNIKHFVYRNENIKE